MTEAEGIVVRVEDGRAWVRTAGEAGSCSACVQRSACGMRGAENDGTTLLCLPNPVRARVGDPVLIRAAGGTVLRAAWLAYGLPLLLALAGALLGHHITGSEGATLVAMLLGLAGGGVLLARHGRTAGTALSIHLKHFS